MKSFKNISRLSQTIKTLAIGAVVAMTCSCEDFLTIYPTNQVVLENYWKTKTDVDNMVANSYRLMTTRDFTSRLLVWGELRGDNVVEGNSLLGDLKHIMEANLLPQNGYNDWAIFYKAINNCNIVMKYAPLVLDEDPDFTEGDMDVARGEMLAIRALCHFYLVRTFRDIPLLKEAMVDDDQDLYQAQATPLEALDFILEDLYEAEKLVMTSGRYPSIAENKGRMTKDAVRAIIADALLWRAAFEEYYSDGNSTHAKEYYTKCAEYCDMIINDRNAYVKKYETENKVTGSIGWVDDVYPLEHHPLTNTTNTGTLDNPYEKIFGSNNNVRESIFELQHTKTAENGNYQVPSFYGRYIVSGFDMGPLSAPRYMAESSDGLYAKTDYRRVSYIQQLDGEEGNYPILKFSYNKGSGTIDKPQYSSYKSSDNGYLDIQTNWIMYRITDVMLMKAEALAFRNDTTAANNADLSQSFDLVKAVYYRSNPYIKSTDSISYAQGNAQSLQELILEERQRELAFEGKRWFDLVRKALRDRNTAPMLDILINHKYEDNQKAIRTKMTAMDCLFFPILEREINTNPLLKQNPAYESDEAYEKN